MTDARVLASSVREERSIPDAEFDRLYPDWVRRASEMHWTPCAVARRAAEWLVTGPTTRVLDVGSGAGKFCIIGSLVTDGLFFGIEQRAGLLEVAEESARRCGAVRTHFIHGDATSIDWRSFDAFYLYNPFYEHVAEVDPGIDEPIASSVERFIHQVAVTSAKLFAAPAGTRVVTYQGYGAPMPPGYRRLACESFDGCELELWRQEGAAGGGGRGA